jgi:hypothetical protein
VSVSTGQASEVELASAAKRSVQTATPRSPWKRIWTSPKHCRRSVSFIDPVKATKQGLLTGLVMEALSLQNYIDPGAGLAQLQDIFTDSDFIFDSLFMSTLNGSSVSGGTPEVVASLPPEPVPMVRTYHGDEAM